MKTLDMSGRLGLVPSDVMHKTQRLMVNPVMDVAAALSYEGPSASASHAN